MELARPGPPVVHDPQRVRASASDTVGRGVFRWAQCASVRARKTSKAARRTARITSWVSTSPSPQPVSTPGARRGPRPSARRTWAAPNTVIVSPVSRRGACRRTAKRLASQSRLERANATASPSRRAEGAVATASPVRASMRSEMRRALGFTLRRTSKPSRSNRPPSAMARANSFALGRAAALTVALPAG